MLRAIPAAQLEAVVAQTRVSPNLHAAFMTYTAAVMLAALGAVMGGCQERGDAGKLRIKEIRSYGNQPDWPVTVETAASAGTAVIPGTGASGNTGGTAGEVKYTDKIYKVKIPSTAGNRPDEPESRDK